MQPLLLSDFFLSILFFYCYSIKFHFNRRKCFFLIFCFKVFFRMCISYVECICSENLLKKSADLIRLDAYQLLQQYVLQQTILSRIGYNSLNNFCCSCWEKWDFIVAPNVQFLSFFTGLALQQQFFFLLQEYKLVDKRLDY